MYPQRSLLLDLHQSWGGWDSHTSSPSYDLHSTAGRREAGPRVSCPWESKTLGARLAQGWGGWPFINIIGHTPGAGVLPALEIRIRRAQLHTQAPWVPSAHCTQFTTPAGLSPAPPTPRALAANAEEPRALTHQWEDSPGMMDGTPPTNGDSGMPD